TIAAAKVAVAMVARRARRARLPAARGPPACGRPARGWPAAPSSSSMSSALARARLPPANTASIEPPPGATARGVPHVSAATNAAAPAAGASTTTLRARAARETQRSRAGPRENPGRSGVPCPRRAGLPWSTSTVPLTVRRKLEILADAAKYDASCASGGGGARSAPAGGVGSTQRMGICHSYTPDGRCVSLLKILLTNHCVYDCQYCVNRRSSDVPRARFEPSEVVDLVLELYRRNHVEG